MARFGARSLLAVLLICLAGGRPARGGPADSFTRAVAGLAPWPWPWPPDTPSSPRGAWERTLEFLWNETREHVGFCVGSKERKVVSLMAQSFPWPLPTGPAEDALCSNRSRLDVHLCGPSEIQQYYKYMLLTENPEKVPDTPACASGSPSPACSPGFFDANLKNRPGPGNTTQEPHACCEGYFCPPFLTCMMPCPLGGHCPRAWPAAPPDEYKGQTGDARWCAPYAYKERHAQGCGGADRWPVIPSDPFPGTWWWAGSGSIFCEGGSYCPNTSAMLNCSAGHFCRQGSTYQERCPLGVHCPPGTEIPSNNFSGMVTDVVLFALLWLLWRLSLLYNAIIRRLERKERLRIAWGAHPEISVVADQEEDGAEGMTGMMAAASSLPAATPPLMASPSVLSLDGEEGEDRQEGGTAHLRRRSQNGGTCFNQHAAQTGTGQRSWLAWLPWRRAHDSGGREGYEALPEGPALRGAASEAELSHSPIRRPLHYPGSPPPGTLNGSSFSSVQHMAGLPGTGIRRRRPRLEVEFRELGLQLKLTHKWVLSGVTGRLHAGRVTAIMGPSGAGKTSLLNTLSGKARYGVQSGEVLVNGRRDRLERFKRTMGFVPQDDIMSASLSVEENLLFSARYRLPASTKPAQHRAQVERALRVLSLEDVRHELVGDEHTRGISGGQKKRVNVGLELVADPSLLFLDEPTSGLDSTASRALVAALVAIVRGGVTAAAVIHQPSWDSFRMFDDVLLLGKGGRTVYYGEVKAMQPYFDGLGYQLPPHANPMDSIMDIISGELTRPGQAPGDYHLLFDAWDEYCGRPKRGSGTPSRGPAADAVDGQGGGRAAEGEWVDTPGTPSRALGRENSCGERSQLLLGDSKERRSWKRRAHELALFCLAYVASTAHEGWEAAQRWVAALDRATTGGRLLRSKTWDKEGGGACSWEEEEEGAAAAARRRTTPGFFRQYYWCLSRAVLKRTREPLRVFTDYAIIALTGMTLGLISDRGRGTIMHYAVSITYSVVALGLISTVGFLGTFSEDRLVFHREAASGLNRLSYFLALESFDHTGSLLRSLVYLAAWYSFAAPRAVLWQMYLVTLAIVYCCSGTAYLLTQVMEPSSAQLAAAVLALVNTLIARQGNPSGLVAAAQNFSFARWGLEGYVISESNRLTGVWLLARCADLIGLQYDVRRFGWCLAALFGLGLVFRTAALACLFWLPASRLR